jgi:type IV pilus assembly protein PilC
MKFRYTATDSEGREVTNVVTVEDRYAVYDEVRKQGLEVVSVEEVRGFSFGGGLSMEKINTLLSRVKQDELVMMTRNLGAMLKAGLALSRAISVIGRQSKNPKLKAVTKDVEDRINGGETFYEALARHPKVFDNLYISMVRAGEESGNLSETLRTLAVQMERSSSLKKKIKGAMIYPSIVIVIMMGIGVLMMIFVIPSITETFVDMDIELPTTTKVLIAVSDFMVAHTILVLAGIVGMVAGFIYSLRTWWGKRIFHWMIIHMPIIGTMVKETNAARTARTLSSLLGSGVDVILSINITQDVIQNVYYKPILADAAARVEKGTPLSASFIEREDLYPVLVGEMILVGEETGQISGMLEQLATFYENEVEQKTKDLSTIIEPLLMVVIGGTVGFFALAMIAPIYSISDSIG